MGTISIDVGQTLVRLALDEAGTSTTAEAPGVAVPLDGHGAAEEVARQLGTLIGRLSPHEPVDAVCIGLSGFHGDPAHAGPIAAVIAESTGARRVVIADDVVPWYLAAVGQEPGVVAAVGTGCVSLAADRRGRWARVDGLGHLLGDDGSGFWVGRSALASALRAADGRGGSESLLTRAIVRYGTVGAIAPAVYRARSPVSEVAAFAPDVARAARDGDPEARLIWDAAGRAVGTALLAAWRRLFPDGEAVALRVVGSLTGAGDLLLDQCREVVAPHGLEVRTADADQLLGVGRLAGLAPGWFTGLVADGPGGA